MKHLSMALLALVAACAAGAAWAGNAYTQGVVHLRAGPSSDYPLVTSIPPSSLLNIYGCLDDFTWCDVDWEGNRGWVYGNYLYYDYQSRRVPILQFGATLGIGIVAFSVGDYWGRYYSGRPWYRREGYWMHRPPPPRGPRPPRGPGGRPPGAGGPPPPRPPHPNRPPRPRPPAGRPTPGPPAPDRPTPGRPAPAAPNPGGGGPPQRPGDKPAQPPGGGRPGRGDSRPGQGAGDRPAPG